MHLSEQFLLRRDITFLNHGSFGACPRPVFETYQQWQRTLEMQPVEFLGRRLNGLLAEAVRTVARGEALIQPSIARKVVAEFSRLAAGSPPAPERSPLKLPAALTERELDVLKALARGMSNKEIAAALVITEGTVKTHISNILAKLDVRDRTQAVLKAQQLRLLESEN